MPDFQTVKLDGRPEDALSQGVQGVTREYLQSRRWFGGKGRPLRGVTLENAQELPPGENTHYWYCVIRVEYEGGTSDRYALPLALTASRPAEDIPVAFAVDLEGERRYATDALAQPEFLNMLYELFERDGRIDSPSGTLAFERTPVFAEQAAQSDPRSRVRLLTSEQSNSSVIYGDAFILKLFRRLESGPNPDLEVLHHLTAHTQYRNVPAVAGFIEQRGGPDGHTTALGALQTFVDNDGDAWQYTLRRLTGHLISPPDTPGVPEDLRQDALRLGTVTGGLHVALAAGEAPDFTPQEITEGDTARWIRALEHEITETLDLLRETLNDAPETYRPQLGELIERESDLRTTAMLLAELGKVGAFKTRYHGDYHLGQVLVANGDFIILDFEGEPARPLAERRALHTPLKDVAGMLRSLSYAAAASVLALPDDQQAGLRERADEWELAARAAFLNGYLQETLASERRIVPEEPPVFQRALRALELEKALYELRYEIRNRPTWLRVPLRGITRLLVS